MGVGARPGTAPDNLARLGGVNRSICTMLRLGSVALLALACGCERPLLTPDEDRSPFDRYDAVRNQHADQFITDEYGRRRPNLRERLMPKN